MMRYHPVSDSGECANHKPSIRRLGLLIAMTSLVVWPVAGAHANNGNTGTGAASRAYAIGLWGDLPYSDQQALVGVPNLLADMNAQKLAFTVHDGDLKAGNGTLGSVTPTTCSDALYTQGLGY